ncbi:MAG: lysylphosphatidylglycerol synthase transmembrane domain-containing protein [Thermoproteota archaeon]|jgi:hypothetical protein|nr:lysylphosphatidylglycerol synthase transmembrane domain-containing protein [Thermoproteota archaeon]
MNWRIAVIPATLIPIIIIIVQFDIKLEDVLAIGVVPFILAVLAIMVKLGLQGLKLAYIARTFLGPFDSIKRLTAMRVGSEFIKFTTPMFVGAEFAVIYYMVKKGISTSRASWVALLDIVTEVLAGGVLSIIAGIFALLNGAYLVAAVVLGTSVTVTTLWVVLFFASSKHTFQLPKGIASLISKFGKERGVKYVKQTNQYIEEVCIMSRENIHSKKSQKVFVVGFITSLISWIFYGISFLVIAVGIGYSVEFFESVLAVMGANAIGNLPITVGGSGLAEFGIIAYLNNLDPFNFVMPETGLEWNAVIGWRIATYYIPIAVTWILLVKLALGKYTKPATT